MDGLMKSRHVVFDLFHTLADPDDFRPLGFNRLEAAAAVLGVPRAVLEAEWDKSLPQLVRGHDSVRGLLRRVASQQGRPARTMDIAPAAEALGRYQDLALLHPRRVVLQLLDALHDRTLGLLTNCHDRDVETWRQSPLAEHLDVVVFSTKSHVAKPDAAAYAAVVAEMGVGPSDVSYVGNGGDDELRGARKAGMGMIVHFTMFDDARGRVSEREQSRRSSYADRVARSTAELAAILDVDGPSEAGPGNLTVPSSSE